MVVFGLRTNVSDFCGFFLALSSSVQKGQNVRMLCMNVEMNMGGNLENLKTAY